MRDIIFMLSSHGWEKLIEEENDMSAIDRLVKRFAAPLEGAQADTDVIKTEFSDMIAHTVQYRAVSSLDYHSVRWRLFHASNLNVLVLNELLFSLPASNEQLEWVFSLLSTVKVDKQSHLTNESLDDLLLLKATKLHLQASMLTPVLTCGGQLKQGDQLRKRERHTGHAAVLVGAHQHLKLKKTPVKTANLRNVTCLDAEPL